MHRGPQLVASHARSRLRQIEAPQPAQDAGCCRATGPAIEGQRPYTAKRVRGPHTLLRHGKGVERHLTSRQTR